MSVPVTLPWSENLLGYDFGVGHPMAPVRLRLTLELLTALGLLDDPAVHLVDAPVADDAALTTVHEAAYVRAVRAASTGTPDRTRGLGTDDDPIFPGMHEASARIVGATLAGARAVWPGGPGGPAHAVSLAGGMHHAMPSRAAGFCVYNDLAAAIAWLLANGCERVLYLDVDAHHGDGVERIFWNDPRVVTLSVHQSGQSLFPGTGFPQDIGSADARGSAINVPLPAGTSDRGWLRAIEAVAGPVVRAFAPQVLVSQHGCDTHARDPLTGLEVSVDGQRAAAQLIAGWAAEHAGGRWLATGGGGYDLVSTVPRAWSHLVAVSLGRPIDPDTEVPAAWQDLARRLTGAEVPTRMGEGRNVDFRPWLDGYDPADPVDRAIMATRRTAFPHHGLEPMTAE
ncbi:acetoin utilization protein AcuC [Ruania albidiflava]|uniref:acetoin utilization protein AcuC n=1 Tax=Ruania albidiflava TaxID=366586 RepID=UPI0003B7B430|nr:acetoin utilization protein AcuC [Ruania albidiflava]